MKIGERIKTLREWKRLNSSEFAKIAHFSAVTLSQYESCTRLPTLYHFYWMCKALGVDFSVLLENSDIARTCETEVQT